jgi:hypothetical protein
VTLIDAPETVIFFAYGNDRKGLLLHNLIADSIESELGLAKAPFVKLYYAGHTDMGYPVAVFSGTRHTLAVGEVYELRLDEKLTSVLEQIVDAGNNLSEVEVELAVGGKIMAMVPTWQYEHGLSVPENDWLSAERLQTW